MYPSLNHYQQFYLHNKSCRGKVVGRKKSYMLHNKHVVRVISVYGNHKSDAEAQFVSVMKCNCTKSQHKRKEMCSHWTHVHRWPFLIECNSIQSKCKKVTSRDSFNIIIGTFFSLGRQLCCEELYRQNWSRKNCRHVIYPCNMAYHG